MGYVLSNSISGLENPMHSINAVQHISQGYHGAILTRSSPILHSRIYKAKLFNTKAHEDST